MAETLDVTSMLNSKFEPHAKRRFLFAIEGIDAYLIKTASRPSVSIEEVAIPWMNSTRYIAGKLTYGTIAVTLHDPIAPSGAQQVMEWIRLHTETVSGRSGYADFYKRDCQIKMVDPVGNVVQLWDLKGCFLSGEVGFGDLTYDGSDLAEISLTLRVDNIALQY